MGMNPERTCVASRLTRQRPEPTCVPHLELTSPPCSPRKSSLLHTTFTHSQFSQDSDSASRLPLSCALSPHSPPHYFRVRRQHPHKTVLYLSPSYAVCDSLLCTIIISGLSPSPRVTVNIRRA